MHITQSLQKWGNGTGVRIPKKVADAAHIHINQQLTVTLKGKSIILTPVAEEKKLSLEDVLTGITPQMVGGELEWIDAVGAERYE